MGGIGHLTRARRGPASKRIAAVLLAGGFAWSCASPVAAGIGLATSSASRLPGSPTAAGAAAAAAGAALSDDARITSFQAQLDRIEWHCSHDFVATTVCRQGHKFLVWPRLVADTGIIA